MQVSMQNDLAPHVDPTVSSTVWGSSPVKTAV